MKLRNFFAIISFSLLIISCKSRYSFVDKYPKKSVPLIDSTSFTNHFSKKILSRKQLKKLNLKSILGEEQLSNRKSKIGISYLPLLSPNFKTIVYYFYTDNTILQSILVNYNHDFKTINYQIVAFDEISDGFLKSHSIINANSIQLKEYNFLISKKPVELYYSINKHGKIILK